MAPHLTAQEVDLIHDMIAQGKTTTEILKAIERSRKKSGIDPPELQA